MRRLTAGIVALAACVLGGGVASAQDIEVQGLRIIEPAADAEPAEGEKGPVCAKVRAVITARPGLTPADFVLKAPDLEPPVSAEAERAVTYVESDEPMAMVILVQGNFRWMGNETYVESGGGGEEGSEDLGPTRYEGAFSGLPPAIDALVKAGPPGSKGALIVHADSADVKQPMGDISQLSGASLGTQQDYAESISKSLIVGLQDSWKMLTSMSGHRKILIVIGDGEDSKEDIGTELGDVIKQLKTGEIETYTIWYAISPDTPTGQQNMQKLGYTQAHKATSRDHFESKAKNIVEMIGAKYYVDWNGADLPFDGEEHELLPVVGGEETEPQALAMVPVCEKQTASEGGLWWLWLLIIAAVVLVLVIIIVIARRKPAPPPMPVVDVPPPVDAGPKKTVMFNMGGGGAGYPVVGWIVPLSGPNQYQTFKLQSGATKIGTGGDAHIVIGDGFMSTIHAEIVCKQQGFVLNDLGSTNGTFVNERKVTEHELVDNDTFVLGKTEFKFKSIN